jgi:hypothetical protein
MMTGLLMAVILYQPVYHKMYELADLAAKKEVVDQKVISKEVSVTEKGDSVRLVKTTHIFEDGTSSSESVKHTIKAGKEETSSKTETLLNSADFWMMVMYVLIQVVLVAMVYGPIAAFLVELFPTRIRYTSMSLPYHIGNGVFGGLTPFIALSLFVSSQTEANPAGDPFVGLMYPIAVAAISFIIGMIFLKNKKKGEVMEE